MKVFMSTYGRNGGIGTASSLRNGAISAQPTTTAATAPRETAGKVARRTPGKNRMLIISSGLHREPDQAAAGDDCDPQQDRPQLGLRALTLRFFESKQANFASQSQFGFFQFPFLHPEIDPRLGC
jgi:hypothetical protein